MDKVTHLKFGFVTSVNKDQDQGVLFAIAVVGQGKNMSEVLLKKRQSTVLLA